MEQNKCLRIKHGYQKPLTINATLENRRVWQGKRDRWSVRPRLWWASGANLIPRARVSTAHPGHTHR